MSDEGSERDAIISTSYLAWVAMMHRTAEAAIANRAQAIDQARVWGATWEQLGAAMGMSRQAAHRRFSQDMNDPPAGAGGSC